MTLPRTTKIAYALPAIPMAALTLPVAIYLPAFYAADMGLDLATVGICLLIARLWDAVTDPAVGILSDHTPHRFGKRKIWIAAGILPTVVSAWFLLVPGETTTPFYLIIWSCLLYTGWTMVVIPLNALGAEMSKNYYERVKITAWREGFTILGVLAALSLINLLALGGETEEENALHLIAYFVIAALPLTFIVFWWKVKEIPISKPGKLTLRKGLQVLRNNGPFRRLIIAYLLNGTANAVPATIFLFFVEHAIGLPEYAGFFLFCYFASGVIGIPFWTYVSRHSSKHTAWCYSIGFACIIFSTLPFIISEGDFGLFLTICLLTGFSVGADLALPAAIQADVIDVDRIDSGRERAGLYFALWGMTTKLALALAAGIFLPLLEMTGFDAETGGNISALPYFYAFVPIALKITAMLLMWRFPLDEAEVERIQQAQTGKP